MVQLAPEGEAQQNNRIGSLVGGADCHTFSPSDRLRYLSEPQLPIQMLGTVWTIELLILCRPV